MEIVGLLVIVILITLIIFFSLAFRTNKPKENTMTTYQDLKIASQLGTIITETTLDCSGRIRKIRELIIDCATLKEINCGTNSCEKINQTIEKILNETLEHDLHYQLTITKENNVVTNFTKPRCQTTRNIQSYPTPIGSTLGPITLMIRICQ